jgi:hypothetical protein
MNGGNEDNLKELFERFVGPEQAGEGAEDILKGEQILRENPAPGPSRELIDGIKSDIARNLQRRRENVFRRTRYEVAAVAAAIIVAATVGVQVFERGWGERKAAYGSIVPVAIWDSKDISVDDAGLAILTTQVEEMENEISTLQKEKNGNGDKAIEELEVEFIEIDSNFSMGQLLWM